MSASPSRKGASRACDIPPSVLEALSDGTLATATLAEGLALDQQRLLRQVFPGLSATAWEAVTRACQQGILKRMTGIGSLLLRELGNQGIDDCQRHPADTVRGWACFMIGARADLDLPERLTAIRPLADDEHFGVREWAWLALRPQLAHDLPGALHALTPWTREPSERLRRFASEALRPRGVWCAHLKPLRQDPGQALSLLTALRADPSPYVQNSVANWLNDAAKDHPDWVRGLCATWLSEAPGAATQRICQRALRNLG
ncbi:HEAT repeat domain-containing protein [Pseudomonas oryzihabitans]|uniref:HEAT repeat domain-containing protein n=1 Tax=Pseudomonas oryzihabitans TaxID=47885 RepID=UPI0028658F5F|nr:HEAT repeat domain-containing protein [Pseudomonas psychrotolerans]MDR6677043.1 3-methyladenine DNA glycosylase AlkC [Pseudomonas psychrotolerans]